MWVKERERERERGVVNEIEVVCNVRPSVLQTVASLEGSVTRLGYF